LALLVAVVLELEQALIPKTSALAIASAAICFFIK
jgi:hypothetical protein